MCVTPRSRGTGGPTSYIPFSSTQSVRQDRNRPRVRNIGRESRNSGLCESVLHRVRLCMLERCDGPVRIRNGSNIPHRTDTGLGGSDCRQTLTLTAGQACQTGVRSVAGLYLNGCL